MRTDFTTAFQAEMTAPGRAPVQLCVIHFDKIGDVFLSDRDLGPADGLQDTYIGIVEDWGTLEDVTGASLAEPAAGIRQLTITLFNGGAVPFSDYFLAQDPENTIVSLYQWFIGLDESDKALIDLFVVQDPIVYDDRNQLVILDLVSVSMRYDAPLGQRLTLGQFPNAKIDDTGKSIDLIFGNAGAVKTLCARTAPKTTLCGSILANALTIPVNDDLDALAFDLSGVIQIDEEKIRYSSRTASQFNVVQRGYLSTAAEHLDRDEIIQHVNDFTYLVGKGPINNIDGVQVGGFDAPPEIYTTHPEMDPARVVFSEAPYAYRFAAGSTFLGMQFDAVNPDNTALWPYRAYDAASDATAARIDKNNRILSLLQATVNPSRGEIVKAYLAVEHWEDKALKFDFAQVVISGVGVVGSLSRPNAADTLNIVADVDIDHNHHHSISGEHSHSFRNPSYVADTTPHTHASNLTAAAVEIIGSPDSEQIYKDGIFYSYLAIPENIQGGKVTYNCMVPAGTLTVNGRVVVGGENTISLAARSSTSPYRLTFKFTAESPYLYCNVWNIKAEVYPDMEILDTNATVGVDSVTSGYNYGGSDKAQNDVEALATDNVPLTVQTSDTASHSHVDLFNITSHVNFDWGWFSNRSITIKFYNGGENGAIYILHAFFDIEYRKRERFFSDEIKANVQGLIDDASGSITGASQSMITRPDHVYQYLLTQCGAFPASMIDSTSFAAAGARFAALGYTIDGVLSGDTTAKEAAKKIAFQTRSRLQLNAGKAKLTVLEKMIDWPAGRTIAADNMQLKSLSARRQPVREIVNHLDAFYQFDWSQEESGAAGYAASTTGLDQPSIEQHGTRKKPDGFLFDLVRTDAMAADLVDFYLDRMATPSTYYDFIAYLENLDLERFDTISLTFETFHKLRKTKMAVAAIARRFASGKNKAINQLLITAECLRYILIQVSAANQVAVMDALNVSKGMLSDFDETVSMIDELLTVHNVPVDLPAFVSDELTTEALFLPQHAEALTVADALGVGVGVNVSDTVFWTEDFETYSHFGFGGGQFNYAGFGGYIILRNRAPDEILAHEQLTVDLTIGAFTDTATIADALFISSGFGCPIGLGFGATLYGD